MDARASRTDARTALVPGATKVSLSSVPSTAVAGAALGAIVARATDDAGAVAAGFASDITMALGTNPGRATLTGTQTVRASNGVATFSNLSLDKVANGYTLTAAASGFRERDLERVQHHARGGVDSRDCRRQ